MEKHERELEGYDVLAKDGNEQADQFSRLCNTIIHHILSFLPVRDAAKTSVLSKRWRRLFASMPILDFDGNCFLEKDGGALRSLPDGALVDFMSAAIVFREKEPINVLRITLDKYTSFFYYPVRQWIQMAMKSNVHEVDLDFSGGDYFLQHRHYAYDPLQAYCCDDDIRHLWDDYPPYDATNDEGYLSDESDLASENSSNSNSDDESKSSYFTIPRALFNCGSLRVLKLAECDITNAGPMSFGNLISLVLIDVEISEKTLHKMLSSCCCKLEELTLSRIPQLKRLAFSAPKLLSLKLECCHSLKKVTIDAKDLRHFKLGLNYTRELLSLKFPSVVKAEIGFCDNINYSNMGQRADRLVKLLKDISHVKDLILYSRFLRDMDIPESQLKSFTMSTVRRLEVIGKMGSDTISTIFSLLKAFGNLESLSLSIVQPYNSEEIVIDHEEKQIRELKNTSTSCLESNLKELKIQGFQGSNIENMMLKFLLDNCKVLEKVDIRTYTPSFWTHGELSAQLLSYCNLKDLKLNYN